MLQSQAIKDARTLRRLTQQHLADAAGISVRTVTRAERDQSVQDESLRALCSVLELDVQTLERPPVVLPVQTGAEPDPESAAMRGNQANHADADVGEARPDDTSRIEAFFAHMHRYGVFARRLGRVRLAAGMACVLTLGVLSGCMLVHRDGGMGSAEYTKVRDARWHYTPGSGEQDADPVPLYADVSTTVAMLVGQAFNLDFASYKTEMQALQDKFTPDGWKEYLAYLEDTGILKVILDDKDVMVGTVTSTPIVSKYGTVGGKRTWMVQADLLATFMNSSKSQSSPQRVTLYLVEEPVRGIACSWLRSRNTRPDNWVTRCNPCMHSPTCFFVV